MRVFLLTIFICLALVFPTFGEGLNEEAYQEEQQVESTEEEAIEVNYQISFKELGLYQEEYIDEELNLRNAVLRFQSQNNLTANGELDEDTRLAFSYRVTSEEAIYDYIQEAATDKYWIVINKSKRILTLYEGTNVVKKYPIAQGKLPGYTPEGKFTIVNKLVDPAWGGAGIYKPVKGGVPENPLGPRWMGLSLKGGGSYGIHGNNSPYSIGTDASLGCIRMINSDVKELFDIVGKDTIVWIGTNERLQDWGVYQDSYLSKMEL